MFRSKLCPDIHLDPEGYRALEEKMFTWHMHVPSAEGYSCLGEIAMKMRAAGADELTIKLLPDSVARLLEKAAEPSDVTAPPYQPYPEINGDGPL